MIRPPIMFWIWAGCIGATLFGGFAAFLLVLHGQPGGAILLVIGNGYAGILGWALGRKRAEGRRD